MSERFRCSCGQSFAVVADACVHRELQHPRDRTNHTINEILQSLAWPECERKHEDESTGLLSLRDDVFIAIGAASMCWEYPERAGVFDSERAKEIGDALLRAWGVPCSCGRGR